LIRIDDLKGALDLIEEARNFREPEYLSRIFFKDAQRLVEKCMDEAEDKGDHTFINRLLQLLPRPDWSPLDQVRHLLRAKFIHRQWWGWDALGIGEKRRNALINMQQEESLIWKRRKERKLLPLRSQPPPPSSKADTAETE
jgi:hypothetical protein